MYIKIFLFSFLIMAMVFYVLWRTQWMWKIYQARRKGLFPLKGKATLYDVRALILKQEPELAIWLYRELYRVSFKDAQMAVEELGHSIQEKKLKT